MNPIAIVSDIHSNLEALNAVLARIAALGIRTIYSLGDTIGYGPDPEACTLLAQSRCAMRLLGNHEHSLLNPDDLITNPVAAQSQAWTRRRLEAAGLLEAATRLPMSHTEGDALFVHGSVRGLITGYVKETDYSGASAFDDILASLKRDFTSFRICFVGHNHTPFLATADGFIHPHEGMTEFYVGSGKMYISVGSVGQPRDEDPRACFVTFDGESVTYHRVAYDIPATQAKLAATGLDMILADRLAWGG
jgi:diadenosine tetraphosphatase ApaH/serine/threonine PP2A family protein phosphatase